MGMNPGSAGPQGLPQEEVPYSSVQRWLLYFTTTRRKAAAIAVFIAGWFGLEILAESSGLLFPGLITNLYFFGGLCALSVLFTHGARLHRPVHLPAEMMVGNAKQRFILEEEWTTSLPPQEALERLRRAFDQPNVAVRTIGPTLWIEIDRQWDAGQWLHRSAAPHLKFRPDVQFFFDIADDGTCITAYSRNRRFAGMYDVLKLADEMSTTAVELARKATTQAD
jgi:hypothetical protein